MSRNSKSARRTSQRKQWSALRKGGGKGPASTEPKHGKRYSYRNPPDHVLKARQEKLKVINKAVKDKLAHLSEDNQPVAKDLLKTSKHLLKDVVNIPLEALDVVEDVIEEVFVEAKPHKPAAEE